MIRTHALGVWTTVDPELSHHIFGPSFFKRMVFTSTYHRDAVLLLLLIIVLAHAAQQDNARCGRRKQARIIGGWQPHVNEYPMQVALMRGNPSWAFCSATIVSPHLVLTAAHCVQRHKAAGVRVLAGVHDYRNRASSKFSKLYAVDRFIFHPHFGGVGVNDVALVRTQNPIAYSAAVGPVCLPVG